ncbi:hypothetical protein HRG_005403 [Hirsutella rhossiliensis]|uniref:N-acetyltransferase domain-containing protein n=1 Tax=Hirsutella rhossiliensis TaxID=111463 RepID=A0A9P8MVK2_9HYPO|nr:uncharacterized protein HRG_05403 [Hirsutella rhossiliensis]KAH0962893.1 hypothetical protein HRG_05403 [Hirsutella rhossiliensis]
MTIQVQIRRAREADIAAMSMIEVESFSDSPYHTALFPKELRARPGIEEQLEWSSRHMSQAMKDPSSRYVVATDGSNEAILGFAEWVASKPRETTSQPTEKTAEESARAYQEGLERLPAYLDKAAIVRCDDETGQLLKAARLFLGDKRLSDMWTLNSIAVAAMYRLKGIGKMLTRWGIDAANEERRDIWLVSAPTGRSMYLSLGFKEVAVGIRAGEAQHLMFRETIG